MNSTPTPPTPQGSLPQNPSTPRLKEPAAKLAPAPSKPSFNLETLIQIGFTSLQAKIYLHLVENGQSTPTEIANAIGEKRTTVYSSLERLEKLSVISQKDRKKISAYVANHPSVLEKIAERRLRTVAREAKNLETNLPSLINFYNEHQNAPGVTTFYGQEGVKIVRDKILSTSQFRYFIRSRYDKLSDHAALKEFKRACIEADIATEDITSVEFTKHTNAEAEQELRHRTILPKGEYDSPIEINIFGDNVAFINYQKDGMSTLIESPEIADAMRQFFKFSTKHIRASTNQSDLDQSIKDRIAQNPE